MRCVDGRRINTVKNVFEGPFFELEVALTMGVMKHRRKPGISRSEGQKWWRQLISKPLMWDLRVTVTTSASTSKQKPPTTSSLEDDARRWREGAAAPRDAEIAPVVVLVRHDHEVAVP